MAKLDSVAGLPCSPLTSDLTGALRVDSPTCLQKANVLHFFTVAATILTNVYKGFTGLKWTSPNLGAGPYGFTGCTGVVGGGLLYCPSTATYPRLSLAIRGYPRPF